MSAASATLAVANCPSAVIRAFLTTWLVNQPTQGSLLSLENPLIRLVDLPYRGSLTDIEGQLSAISHSPNDPTLVWAIADWLIRTIAVERLQAAGLVVDASTLSALPQITDQGVASEALPALWAISSEAFTVAAARTEELVKLARGAVSDGVELAAPMKALLETAAREGVGIVAARFTEITGVDAAKAAMLAIGSNLVWDQVSKVATDLITSAAKAAAAFYAIRAGVNHSWWDTAPWSGPTETIGIYAGMAILRVQPPLPIEQTLPILPLQSCQPWPLIQTLLALATG